MNRRGTVIALATLGAAPLLAYAQQPGKVWRIGHLYIESRQSLLDSGRYQAFILGMRELGYVEGKNYVMEERYANGDSGRLFPLAEELVKSRVNVIVIIGTGAGLAAQRATSTIPIVLAAASDPVGSGLVASLAHPGKNITGLSLSASDVTPKNVEILKIAMPKLSRLAVLMHPDNGADPVYIGFRGDANARNFAGLNFDLAAARAKASATPAAGSGRCWSR